MDEVIWVLAPRDVAHVKQDGRWTTTVKPVPPEVDDWTHYLHDPSGNAVAHDTLVAPPLAVARQSALVAGGPSNE